MRAAHLSYLVCPECAAELQLAQTDDVQGEHIQTGALVCLGCQPRYPIEGGVPRFVPSNNYAAGFGLEWNQHARTQDSTRSWTSCCGP